MGEIEASFGSKTKILNRKKPKKTGDNSNTAKKNDNYSKTSDGKKKNHSKKKWQKEMPNQFGLVLLTLIQTIISIICYCLTLKGLAKKSCDTWQNTKKMTYIGHREGTNAFWKRKDEKQGEKEGIIKATESVDSKTKKSTTKSTLSLLKTYKKRITE